MDDNRFDDFYDSREEDLQELRENSIINNNSNVNNTNINTSINTNNNINTNIVNSNVGDSINDVNKFNKPIKKQNNNKTIIIIGGVLLVVIVGFLLYKFIFSGHKAFNGYTAEAGEVLKVREIGGKFNLKVLSGCEEYVSTEKYMYTGNYIRLQVLIENVEMDELSFVLTSFSLLDVNKQELASSLLIVPDSFPQRIYTNTDINSKSSMTGYLYFEGKNNLSSDLVVSQSKYLKVSAVASINKEEYQKTGIFRGEYEDYYVKLD